jgi:hypothetical protein
VSSKNSRLRVAFLALVVAVAGLAAAGPAAAATHQTATGASAQRAATAASDAPQEQAPVIPVDFVDLPTSPLPVGGAKYEFAVTYRNASSVDETVAPQLLVESPDSGPFLAPSDVKVERRTAGGCWKAVQLGSQTGTLFTDLSTARRTVHAGGTLIELYRVTVVNPEAQGTVHPRVALFD